MAQLGALNRDVEVNNGGGGGSFTLLADAPYELEIIESDVKANTKGSGQNLELKVQVASGPNQGVWFFHSITSIQHTSAQAQAIGQGQLRALCEAIGPTVDFATLSDSVVLHNRPFWAQVGHEEYFSTKHQKQVTKNVIEKFLWEGMPEEAPKSSAPPASKPQPSAPPAQPAAAPASTGQRRPWSPK